MIIPLQVELTPYGFINKIQGLKLNPEKISFEIDKIVQVIYKKSEDFKEFFIERFIESNYYETANYISNILQRYDTFSEEEVKKICKGSLGNTQVTGAFGAKLFLKKLIDVYERYVDPSDLSELKVKLEREYPFY